MLEGKKEVLSLKEVSEILNVSMTTLRRWDNKGILQAFRPSKTQPRRYRKQEIVDFLQKRPN
jgi:DNA-binding transcriptional MerR regulator